MRDINILINEDHSVDFENDYAGLNGENLQGNIVFKFKNFVNGQARAEVVIDNQDGYILLEKVGETYTMPILSSLLTSDFILMQLVIDEPGEDYPIWKSEVFTLKVGHSINAETTIPEDYPSWVQILDGLINDVEEEIQKVDGKIQEIDTAIEETNNLNIEVSKEDDVTTITLTKKDGQVEETEVLDGRQGEQGETGLTPNIQIGNVTTGSPSSVTRRGTNENPILDFVLEQGEQGQKGDTGNGIQSVTKTSTSGLVDTYTISYTNATATTYNVTNGNGISSIEKTAETPSQKDYRINYTNGEHFDYSVENGEVTQSQLDEVIAENNYLNSIIDQIVPKTTATGTSITLDDTLQAKMNMSLSPSELEQETTTGKNLFDTSLLPITKYGVTISKDSNGNIVLNGTPGIQSGYIGFVLNDNFNLNANTYTLSLKQKMVGIGVSINTTTPGGALNITMSESTTKATATTTADLIGGTLSINVRYDVGTLNNYILNPQLEEGSTDTSYEPYTGGIASPNPQYPQEVHTISGNNTIKINGKNLFNQNILLSGTSITYNGEYYVGTITNYTNSFNNSNPLMQNFKENTQYTISLKTYLGGSATSYIRVLYTDNTNNNITINNTTLATKTFTTDANKTISKIYLTYYDGGTINWYIKDFQIEEGTTASDFTPYQEQTAQVNLGDLEYSKMPNTNYSDEFMKPSNNNLIPTTTDKWEQGTIASATGENSSSTTRIRTIDYYPITPGNNYISIVNTGYKWLNIMYYDSSKTFITAQSSISSISGSQSALIDVPNNTSYFRATIAKTDATATITASDMLVIEPMVNKGSSALPYEPYNDDRWYLKKNIGNPIFDGSETYWNMSTGTNRYSFWFFYTDVNCNETDYQAKICNNFSYIKQAYSTAPIPSLSENSLGTNYRKMFVFNTDGTQGTTIEDWKTWLSTHNTIVYYPLATPQYILLNDTLQSQLDTIESMLLSYKKQTNISQINNDLPFIMTSTALKEL